METFGEALRRIRNQRGYSLREFSRVVTFGYTYIGQVERNEKPGSDYFASHVDEALSAGGALVRLYVREDQQRRGWRDHEVSLAAPVSIAGHVASVAGGDTTALDQHFLEGASAACGERTPAHEFDELGLSWSPSVTNTVDTIVQMWRADMLRREFLIGSAFAAGGFTPAVRDWLLSWRDTDASHKGGRAIGESDVCVLWDVCYSFQEMDRRLGGAVARTSLVHFLDQVVSQMLEGSYDEATGRQLLAVAGRLTDIAAYSAYDAHEQGMAQRYYIQALRMARSADNESLGAHILGDMTRQAYYIGDLPEAVALARAGQQAAKNAGSQCGFARCASLEARALAMRGDRVGADDAIVRAEQAMEKAKPDRESPWIRYFSFDQLQAEFAHAAEAMSRTKQVLEFAQPALTAERPLERRNLLVGATAARAHAKEKDIEQAAALGIQVLDLVRSVASERGIEAARALRARLNEHHMEPAVQEFEAKAQDVLGPSGAWK